MPLAHKHHLLIDERKGRRLAKETELDITGSALIIANQLGHRLEMTLNIYGKCINAENDGLEPAKIEGQEDE